MFEFKIKQHFDNSFHLLEQYLSDSTVLTPRPLAIGDWIMLCSIIAERNGEMEMFSVSKVLSINAKENVNILEQAGQFSVVLIRGCVEEITPEGIIIRIEEDKESIFYKLNTENKKCYNNLLSTDSFTWDAVKSPNNEFFFMDPTLEELPLFLLNLTKIEDVYTYIASKVLNTITGIAFPRKEQEDDALTWYNAKRDILIALMKKVEEEHNHIKH